MLYGLCKRAPSGRLQRPPIVQPYVRPLIDTIPAHVARYAHGTRRYLRSMSRRQDLAEHLQRIHRSSRLESVAPTVWVQVRTTPHPIECQCGRDAPPAKLHQLNLGPPIRCSRHSRLQLGAQENSNTFPYNPAPIVVHIRSAIGVVRNGLEIRKMYMLPRTDVSLSASRAATAARLKRDA